MSAAAFQVTVWLDGDDDRTQAVSNVRDVLDCCLEALEDDGQIRAWNIHKEEA